MKKIVCFLLLSTAAFAQYTLVPSSSYPTLDGILNGKLAFTTGVGAPGGACTAGKDVYTSTAGLVYWCSATNTWSLIPFLASLGLPVGSIIGTTDTQTLTNKTVDGVTPTIFGYIDATSSIQTQLNGKQASLGFTAENAANKGASSGYAGLNSGGQVPAGQMLTAGLNGVMKYTGGTPSAVGVSTTTFVHPDGSSGGGAAAGAANAVQGSNGSGVPTDTGCTGTAGAIACPGGFSGGSGPMSLGGPAQTSSALGSVSVDTAFFDSANSDHLTRKDTSGVLHDTEAATRIVAYEVGTEDAAAAFLTADLTNHSVGINDAAPRTLTEASCTSDAGSQVVTLKIGGTTLFSITCVAYGSYSRGTTTGSTGYIVAGSMGSTAIAAGSQLDLSGTANTTTKDVKLFVYAVAN